MFSAVIVNSTPERSRVLHSLALETGEIEILRDLDSYPNDFQLHRLLELAPDLVLLDMAAGPRAVECALLIHARCPATAVIGHGDGFGGDPSGMRAGFSAMLAEHSSVSDLRLAIAKGVHAATGGVEANLFSFLPSKAGSGASTIVLNTAAAMAAQFGKK